jgi:uncharacterized protein DUF6897
MRLSSHSSLPIRGEEMQEFLSRMVGRKIDISCGNSASLRGEVIKVEGGVLHLRDEDQHLGYVAIDKIAVVWEARETEHRAGFVSEPLNNR